MLRSPSTILFALVLAFALTLVGWWALFQTRECQRLAAASAELTANDADAAARALGADNAAALADLARRRRTMFLSEASVFALILGLGGVLYLAATRSEARMRANQDRFLAGATHELKTPLATLRLLLESLRDERVPAEKRDRYLATGLMEVERLERDLTNLLTVAGLRSVGRILHREAGDLGEDVGTAAAAMASRAEAAGITLQIDTAGPVPVVRDPDAMQLVLRNLLDNAVKYSDRGATVDVALRREGDAAVLTVADQGRGMDADELGQVFMPFYRGDGQSSGGAGLGLHLVRELVTAHGGTVAAASPGPGRGAVFTVRLPAKGGLS